ncbi:MAG: hypothetical protein HYY34_01320, partial [Chloroflexi bacterium]|nr:hypothetical protein [Chloroflexota bacterium]
MPEDKLGQLLSRHKAFWDRTSVDKPLLNLTVQEEDSLYAPLHGISIPLADGSILCEQGEPLTAGMIDPRLIVGIEECPTRRRDASRNGPLTVGDLLVVRAPWGKLPWVEAVLGCPVIPRLDTGGIYSWPYLN